MMWLAWGQLEQPCVATAHTERGGSTTGLAWLQPVGAAAAPSDEQQRGQSQVSVARSNLQGRRVHGRRRAGAEPLSSQASCAWSKAGVLHRAAWRRNMLAKLLDAQPLTRIVHYHSSNQLLTGAHRWSRAQQSQPQQTARLAPTQSRGRHAPARGQGEGGVGAFEACERVALSRAVAW